MKIIMILVLAFYYLIADTTDNQLLPFVSEHTLNYRVASKANNIVFSTRARLLESNYGSVELIYFVNTDLSVQNTKFDNNNYQLLYIYKF